MTGKENLNLLYGQNLYTRVSSTEPILTKILWTLWVSSGKQGNPIMRNQKPHNLRSYCTDSHLEEISTLVCANDAVELIVPFVCL